MCYNEFVRKTIKYKEIRAMADDNTILNQLTAIFQMDKAESENQDILWQIGQWCSFPNMDCPLRLFSAIIYYI